ncbi:MAG: hypothetical protein Q4E81_05755 [Succinatimonas sp.]|nr:hypothetical protein [Succinatimonas sp.]
MYKYILIALFISFKVLAAGNSQQPELHSMLNILNKQTKILKEWSQRNQKQNEELLKLSDKSSQREDLNHKVPNKNTWDKVKKLNQNSRLLLEACADTVDEYVSIGNYIKAYERSKAWNVCQDLNKCDFYNVTSSYNQETLELAQDTQEKGEILGKNLQQALAELDNFNLEAQSAEGLNASIDTLSKVNSMTANSIITLTSQLNNLLNLSSLQAQKQSNLELLNAKADEEFLQTYNINSEHFSLNMDANVN